MRIGIKTENGIVYTDTETIAQVIADTRCDAKEAVEWITVNGNHIPVDPNTGKAVGGQQKALGSTGVDSLKKSAKEWKDSISKDELKDIRAITGGSINKKTAASKMMDDVRKYGFASTSAGDRIFENTKSAISKFEVKEPFTCYRGTDSSILGKNNMTLEDIKSMVGKTIGDTGFTEASTSLDTGDSFAHGGARNILLKINVPSGKGIGAFVGDVSINKDESEFMFQSKSTFVVKGVSETKHTNGFKEPLYEVELDYSGIDKSLDGTYNKEYDRWLERKNKKSASGNEVGSTTRFYDMYPKDNYMEKPEYKAASKKFSEAARLWGKLNEDWCRKMDEVKKEQTPKPRSEWNEEDEYMALIGVRPTNTTEKGKRLQEEADAIWEEKKKADEEMRSSEDAFKTADAAQAKSQRESWEVKDPKKATQSEYKGFLMRTNTDKDEYIDDPKSNAYISEMTPEEYLKRCAYEVFGSTYERELTVGKADRENTEEYTKKMMSGVKFDMPYIDYNDDGQEGRHRAIAAYNAGIEKMPVLVIGRPKSYEEKYRQRYEDYLYKIEGINDDLPDDILLEEFDSRLDGEEVWRTTENGKHYAIDPKTGEVVKGNIGTEEVRSETVKNGYGTSFTDRENHGKIISDMVDRFGADKLIGRNEAVDVCLDKLYDYFASKYEDKEEVSAEEYVKNAFEESSTLGVSERNDFLKKYKPEKEGLLGAFLKYAPVYFLVQLGNEIANSRREYGRKPLDDPKGIIYGLERWGTGAQDGGYGSGRNARKLFDEKYGITKFIKENPDMCYCGDTIYRGVQSNDQQYEALKKAFESGKKISMNGISSWSSKEDISLEFCEYTLKSAKSGKHRVIFVEPGEKKRSAIPYPFKGQNEVLYGDVNFKIKDIQEKSVAWGGRSVPYEITYVTVESME